MFLQGQGLIIGLHSEKSKDRRGIMPQYKHYVCDVPDLEQILEEINTTKETIVGCFYASDAQQVVLIVEGARDILKEKIKNIINPSEREYV